MSYGVNFWQKSLVYQEGISRIILWSFLFLVNCIVRNQQLSRDRVRYENRFLIMYCHVDRDASLSVHILLLHHYKSNLAHISDFDSLVIGLSKSERWAKSYQKRMTSSICMKFAHFWVVLVRKCMVKKFLISYRFEFLDRFFSAIFWWFRTSFFIVFVQNWMVRNESVLLLSQNGK